MLSSSSFDQIARVLKYTVWKKKIPSLALRSHDKGILNYDDNEIINILTETLINFSSITAYSRLTTFCKKNNRNQQQAKTYKSNWPLWKQLCPVEGQVEFITDYQLEDGVTLTETSYRVSATCSDRWP